MKRNFFVKQAFTGLKQIFTVLLNVNGSQSKIKRDGNSKIEVMSQVNGELIDCGSQSLASFKVLGRESKWSSK